MASAVPPPVAPTAPVAPAANRAGGGTLELILLHADVGAPGTLLRVAAGAALAATLMAVAPEAGVSLAAASLAALLFGIKAAAAVARRVLPASPVVNAHWEWRRGLARWHDSYQWRKLLWFGIGIALAAAASARPPSWTWSIAAACAAGGAAGELVWRRKGRDLSPPARR